MLYSSISLSFQHAQLPLILINGLVEADHAHKFLVEVRDLHRFLILFLVTTPLGVILCVDFIFGIILVKFLFQL